MAMQGPKLYIIIAMQQYVNGPNLFRFVVFESLASQIKEGKSYTIKNFRMSKF